MDIKNVICKIRCDKSLDIPEFSKITGIDPDDIEDYESGRKKPSADELILISKKIGVSLNQMFEVTKSIGENVIPSRTRHLWESYEKELLTEYRQSYEEGLDIERFEEIFSAASRMPEGKHKKKISDILYEIVSEAEIKDDYGYFEPCELDIIKLFQKEAPLFSLPSKKELEEKIRGAWIGRICGCMLGKPVEGIMREELDFILKSSGNYPMRRYIMSEDISGFVKEKVTFDLSGKCYADTIECAVADDDTNYTVMAALMIDKYGKDFSPCDVMDMWISSQSKDAYCTAERVAYINYINGYKPPYSALYKNPYREWIGAEIRSDYYGYIFPGEPMRAADAAYRDASVSHVKNGVYGAMFTSALISCAAVTSSIVEALEGALAVIPQTSRLYEKIREIMKWREEGFSEKQCKDEIYRIYDEKSSHDWCHAIPNLMIVVTSLLYNDTYGKAVCSAVGSGFDTDCNGATVGSVFGMMHGEKSIGDEWSSYINGKLKTDLFGGTVYTVKELAELTLKHLEA